MQVVILAGGFGTRLAEHTEAMPKPMVEVGGWPILWHILKIYSHFGFRDFLIAGGYRCEAIKRFFLEYRHRTSDVRIDLGRDTVEVLSESAEPWRVAVIDTGEATATGGRIKRLCRYLNKGPFMMTYGDGVADIDVKALVSFHERHGRLATFTAVPAPGRFGQPVLEGDRAVAFEEKPGPRNDQWINAGFFVLQREVIERIGGDETSFEITTLPRLASDGELMAYRHEGFWHPMDTLRDVRNLNRLFAEGSAPWEVWRR